MKDDEIVGKVLNHYAQYHNFKETMTYAGVLLQVGIFASVMTIKQWPPCWLDSFFYKSIVLVIFSFAWLLIHMFIGWQLLNKRLAAKRVAACIDYIASGQCAAENEQNNKTGFKLYYIIFWPTKNSILYKGDCEIDKPKKLKEILNIRESKPPKLIEDWLLFVGSIAMLIAIIIRTFELC